jgi:tRNA(Ile)-lysidine synthase
VSAPQPPARETDLAVSGAEFAAGMAALGPFERLPRLAVAVSGGPDSLALTLLAIGWAGGRGGDVLGLHVDHGLRPEAAGEAGQVAGWMGAWGVPCLVLAWEGAKPATGVQAAARVARYALLEAACRKAGILHLLLGHHADDLAETAFMRAEMASGPAGQAGMAAIVERPGLRLLRPLLAVPRARLAATLREHGQPSLDDPSNAQPRFRRARLRRDPGFDPARWLAVAARAATARARADRELARFAARAVSPDPLGFLDIDLDAWRRLPPAPADLALARSLLAVSGAAYPPPAAGVAALRTRLRDRGAEVRATLGGALLTTRGRSLTGPARGRPRPRPPRDPAGRERILGRPLRRHLCRAGPGP